MTTVLEARATRFEALGTRSFDVLVIGGGVTGCGIARDAALRGFRVALVEKDDFASGTSSRSSRLIHGGVRYLEHGQLRLVFEASAERRRLMRLAPHLVRPLAFTWPVYAGARISQRTLAAGLSLYDVLALFRNIDRHRGLTRAGVLNAEPALRNDGLLGGARYFDAATNDARLTLANAVAAAEAGAVVANHTVAGECVMHDGRVAGATIHDAFTGQRADVRATIVVTATGPWTRRVRGSKGAHIAVPRDRVGNRDALTLLSPRDGRVLFALPAGRHTIFGTTDTYTSSSPDEVRASNEEVRYLIEAANLFFPAAALSPADVVSAWAGIRPLLPSADDDPDAASREHAVTTSEDGVVSIAGGKLTTYRIMARDVVDVVASRLGRVDGRGRGRRRAKVEPLPGGTVATLDDLVDAASRTTGDRALAIHLTSAHGARWERVWRAIEHHGGRTPLEDDLPYTVGELRYAVEQEMAATLGDLLIRRTHLAFETTDHGMAAAEVAADALASEWGWAGDARRQALDAYAAEIDRIFSIDTTT